MRSPGRASAATAHIGSTRLFSGTAPLARFISNGLTGSHTCGSAQPPSVKACLLRKTQPSFFLFTSTTRGFPAFSSPFTRARLTRFFTATRTTLLPTATCFVDGRPSTAFCFFFRSPALFVTFFDVLGLTFLFAAVFRFTSSWHFSLRLKFAAHNHFGLVVQADAIRAFAFNLPKRL